MLNKKGFIPIPILIAIIAGVLVLGSSSFYGYQQYQKRQNIESLNRAMMAAESVELGKLRQEIEILKKNDKVGKPIIIPKEKPPIEPVKSNQIISGEEISAKISPAVVLIKVADGSSGSGMIIEREGIVLTNAHIVEGISSVTIKLADKRAFPASVIGRDEIIDLAVLRVLGGDARFPIVTLGDSDSLKGGAKLYAFGYPLGLPNLVQTGGVFSARQEIDNINYIQTDAPIHGGSSGGPLVNDQGQVIGINTLAAKIKGDIGGVGLGFALPVNLARAVIPDLKNGIDIVIPNKPTLNQHLPSVDDYTSPVIKSITAERPAGNQDVIAVTINTNEPSTILATFTFEFSPQNNDKLWKIDTDKARETTIISVPSPSYHDNTKMHFSVKATDAKGNIGKIEYYSLLVADVPGMGGANYSKPKVIK